MDKKIIFGIAVLIVMVGAFAAYLYWQPKPKTEIVQEIPVPPAPPKPELPASRVVEAPPALPPLPQLAQSDSFVFDALAEVISDPALMKLFHANRVIHNIVVTVDNLPQERVPVKLMPFNAPKGNFLTSGTEGHLSISPKNANRYAAYVKIAEAVDARKLVELYVRLYPLLQQSYEDLGYLDRQFNDQLADTLDDLLDTPDAKEPIRLVQPKYFYLFANPELEELTVGQKIMLRLGSSNEKIVKSKLLEIKQELALRAKDLKAGGAN
jgi:hypothetical protein